MPGHQDDPSSDETIRISPPERYAAGVPGAAAGARAAVGQMGVARTVRTLLKVNQTDGFDCPGCAWPEPTDRSHLEFCENGAKAVAEEATRARADAAFFAAHTLDELRSHDEHWLGQQGRLTEPMVRRRGSDRYEPISWDDALGAARRRSCERSTIPTRPSSTPRVGPATRRPSSTSCSCGASAPTTCRTARTCATSPAAAHSRPRSASARDRSPSRTWSAPT